MTQGSLRSPGHRAAHAFVADLVAPELSAEDRRHLERVLRLRPGEEVSVSDGAGRWRLCRFGPALEPAGEVQVEDRGEPELVVALALTKGERFEWAVQKLTELGVDRVVPVVAARSVVRWDGERADHHLARLRRVATQAAMQSRRCWLPVVDRLHSFAEAAALPGAALAERGGAPLTLGSPVVLVGPEGGWDDDELDAGLPRVALGRHVLRSETAAMTAGALLTALRAGLATPPS